MNHIHLLSQIFLILLVTGVVISSRPIVAKEGEAVAIPCAVFAPGPVFQWIVPDQKAIADSLRYDASKYGLIRSMLVVYNVEISDGGKYRCYRTIDTEPGEVELIVLGNVTLDVPRHALGQGVSTDITCTALYGASTLSQVGDKFKMEVTLDGENLDELENSIVDLGPGETSVYHMLVTYEPDKKDDGKWLSCRFFFDSDLSAYAEIKHELDVIYSLTNLTILTPDPVEDTTNTFTVGQNFTCVAQGNPAPTFVWMRESSNESNQMTSLAPRDIPYRSHVRGALLTIDGTMVGRNVWVCEATQISFLANSTKRITFDVVDGSGDPAGTDSQSSGAWKVAVGVGLPILWIISCILSVYHAYRRDYA